MGWVANKGENYKCSPKASYPSRLSKTEVRKHLNTGSESFSSKWLMVFLNAAESGFCVHKCPALLRLSVKER